MNKLKSRAFAVSVCCALFGLPGQVLFPGSLSAQESEDAAGQPEPAITLAQRLEQRIEELEKTKLRYEASLKEQEHLRQRVEELEREKVAQQDATNEQERLSRRVEELETSRVAHEDATRTIIRQSVSTLGSKVNEFVTLGGTLEVSGGYAESFGDTREGTKSSSDRDLRLNTAELDFEVQVNDWTLGSMIFAYEDGRDSVFRTTDEREVSVDRVNIDTAFITIGDPQRFWGYGRFGRMVVPFGISTGAAIGDVLTLTDPLTVEAFEMKEDAILFGVEFPTPPVTPTTNVPSPVEPRAVAVRPLMNAISQSLGYRPFPRPPPTQTSMALPPTPPPFSAGVYVYNGETFSGLTRKRSFSRDKHFGATVGYTTKGNCRRYASKGLGVDRPPQSWLHFFCPWGIDLDLDFNNSVFDSRFLEAEYRPFLGQIGYVNGMAGSAKATLGPISLMAEWNGALEDAEFRDHDLLLLRRKPSAWQVTAAYQFDWNPGVETIGAQGTYVALGYSESQDMQGVTRVTGLVNRSRAGFIPRERFLATVGEWIMPGVRLGIQYSHDEDYSKGKGGTGRSADAILSMLTYEW